MNTQRSQKLALAHFSGPNPRWHAVASLVLGIGVLSGCAARSASAKRVVVTPVSRLPLDTLCETETCGVDSKKYASLLGDQQPVQWSWSEILGNSFSGGTISRETREECASPMTAALDDDGSLLVSREISWQGKRAQQFQAALEVDIMAAIQQFKQSSILTKFSADASAVAKDAANKAVSGTATFDLRVYKLTGNGVEKRRADCADKGWVVSQVAEFVSNPSKTADDVAVDVSNKLGVSAGESGVVSASLQASLQETIKAKVSSTYQRQSFVAAVGWLK